MTRRSIPWLGLLFTAGLGCPQLDLGDQFGCTDAGCSAGVATVGSGSSGSGFGTVTGSGHGSTTTAGTTTGSTTATGTTTGSGTTTGAGSGSSSGQICAVTGKGCQMDGNTLACCDIAATCTKPQGQDNQTCCLPTGATAIDGGSSTCCNGLNMDAGVCK